MEASSEAPRVPVRTNTWDRVRKYIGEYGLIALLLVMPVVYGIQDLSDDGSLARLGNNIVDGLSNGAIWALVALGYTLVYGIIELINFAHGEVFMIGSLVSAGFFGTIGLTAATGTGGLVLGLFLTLLLAMLASGMLNVMIETGGLPTIKSGAQAGAADHGGRLQLHPPERRRALDRRLAGGHHRPDQGAEGGGRHRRRVDLAGRRARHGGHDPARLPAGRASSTRAGSARRCALRRRTPRPRA